jgi:hypothetical protein
VIFDIVEYIIMEWTMLNESRICRICRRVPILKKRRRVLLTILPHSSTGQKRIARLKKKKLSMEGGRQVLGLFFFTAG